MDICRSVLRIFFINRIMRMFGSIAELEAKEAVVRACLFVVPQAIGKRLDRK
jgi:hypothetical protein